MKAARGRKILELAKASGAFYITALEEHLASQPGCSGARVLRYQTEPRIALLGDGIDLELGDDELTANASERRLSIERGAGGWQRELCNSMETEGCVGFVLRDEIERILGLLIAHGGSNFDELDNGLDLESYCPRLEEILGRELADQDLAKIVELAGKSGDEFMESLVLNLGKSLRIKMAFVAKPLDAAKTTARSIAFYCDGKITENIEYALSGTPCEEVLSKHLCVITNGVQQAFPTDVWLQQVGAIAYLGIPIIDGQGESRGHMAVVHDAPIRSSLHEQALFQLYAALAGSEIIRHHAEQESLSIQRQLMEGQKLESLGTLAGGIAHDFNNLLVGITGYVSLALSEISPVSPIRDHLKEIEKAGQRAAELAKQMLAYSGKGRFVVADVNLSEIVQEMSHLLQVSIPPNIVLHYQLAEDLPATQVDPTQIRQVMMNLLLNAVDAIGEENGTITLITGRVHADASYLKDAAFGGDQEEGDYLFLEVADTGCGMDAETKKRAFDPFYSTKQAGRGLGLAAAQGIVKGHRGVLKVYSEQGKGTSFKFLLPIHPVDRAVAKPKEPTTKDLPAGCRILVIDDESIVRDTIGQMLSSLGLEITLVETGKAGLEIIERERASIDGVLLDMSMPGMSGEETFRALHQSHPKMRILLMSGYNEQDAISHFAGKGLAGFLQKPFNMAQLRAAMFELLH